MGRGHQITAFARASSQTASLEAAGVRVVRGDLRRVEDVSVAAEDSDAIVHAAGGGIVRDLRGFYEGNTETTRALVAGAPKRLEHFVLISSLAAHGPSGRTPATEDDVDSPRSHYGRSKLAAERAAMRLGERARVTVLRPPALFGPGEHRMVALFQSASRGVVPMVHPTGSLSMLSGADCASAVGAALDGAHEGMFYVAERKPISREAMARAIGRGVGRSVRVVPIPTAAMHCIGVVAEGVAHARGRTAMINRDKVADMVSPHQTCDPRLAIDTLDWAPSERFVDAAPDIASAYRERGWLS